MPGNHVVPPRPTPYLDAVRETQARMANEQAEADRIAEEAEQALERQTLMAAAARERADAMRLAANHPGVPGARRGRSPTSTTGRWMAQPAADAPPAAPRELIQHRMGQYQQPPAAPGPVYAPPSRGLDQFKQMIALAEKASGSELHRWAYREFARTGIMFFKHLWDPRAHEDFVDYVRSASLTTQRVVPMFQRYNDCL